MCLFVNYITHSTSNIILMFDKTVISQCLLIPAHIHFTPVVSNFIFNNCLSVNQDMIRDHILFLDNFFSVKSLLPSSKKLDLAHHPQHTKLQRDDGKMQREKIGHIRKRNE